MNAIWRWLGHPCCVGVPPKLFLILILLLLLFLMSDILARPASRGPDGLRSIKFSVDSAIVVIDVFSPQPARRWNKEDMNLSTSPCYRYLSIDWKGSNRSQPASLSQTYTAAADGFDDIFLSLLWWAYRFQTIRRHHANLKRWLFFEIFFFKRGRVGYTMHMIRLERYGVPVVRYLRKYPIICEWLFWLISWSRSLDCRGCAHPASFVTSPCVSSCCLPCAHMRPAR